MSPATFEVSETSKVSDAKCGLEEKETEGQSRASVQALELPHHQAVLDEIGKAAPAYAGIRWETLGEGGLQWTAAHWRGRRASVEPVEDRGDCGPGPRAATCW